MVCPDLISTGLRVTPLSIIISISFPLLSLQKNKLPGNPILYLDFNNSLIIKDSNKDPRKG